MESIALYPRPVLATCLPDHTHLHKTPVQVPHLYFPLPNLLSFYASSFCLTPAKIPQIH